MHQARRFRVAEVVDAEDLSKKLTEQSWTLCTGFRLGDLLFLNDATSEDGAPEWAVFHLALQPTGDVGPDRSVPLAIQIESITFGWMTSGGALGHIRRLESGALVTPMGRCTLRLDHPTGDCGFCA